MEYIGLHEIKGSLAIFEGVKNPSYEEIVTITCRDNTIRTGRVVQTDGDKTVVLVFEGTQGLSLDNTRSHFTGVPMEIGLSEEMLGRVFNGLGRPLDDFPKVFAEETRDVNGQPLNPVMRRYPHDYIHTGISVIDTLTTLVRGQKLPIFSGNGLPHDRLAAQIIMQAINSVQVDQHLNFAVVFAAMGVKHDAAEYFKKTFEESGVSERVVMFLNLANDPVAERIITPRVALSTAEYLAYKKHMHILVVLTDMTAYCEALREISSARGEIPSRKGYPGYLYSDLASIYERAGLVKDSPGSITQIPILTMPGDDITHPIPDLTGYITEGQIVLDRGLLQSGIYPPVSILPSLSRLMKDGIGDGYTRTDHPELANQLFSSYAKVGEVRALASVIGVEELNKTDAAYMAYGQAFEHAFLHQDMNENRGLEDSFKKGWDALSLLPKAQLDRVTPETLEKYYKQ